MNNFKAFTHSCIVTTAENNKNKTFILLGEAFVLITSFDPKPQTVRHI